MEEGHVIGASGETVNRLREESSALSLFEAIEPWCVGD